MSLIERIKKKQLDWPLAILQILAFGSTVAFVIDGVLLYRHFTDDALTPALTYFRSLKLAFPPIIVLGVTYFYAFLTGESVSNAPKSMWRYTKNIALQSRRQLLLFLLLAFVVSLSTMSILRYHTPPAYDVLVTQLLGGANDDNQVIKDAISRLKSNAPTLSDRLTAMAKVFEERRLWNNENKTPSTFLPRVFIRQLETDSNDHTWKNHPLRHFALAEAHSMLAQALSSLRSDSAKPMIVASRQEAIASYRFVMENGSNLSTDLMKRSAHQNIGNVYLYSSNCVEANKIYSQLSISQLNAGTEGNRVAALVNCGKIPEAIRVGTEATSRLQGKPEVLKLMRDYVSLLTNTGFAKMIVEKYTDAFEDMQAAHDLIPDQMAKQNLALAMIGLSRPRDAIAILEGDTDAPPVSPESQLQIVIRNGGGSCTYLIRAVALAAAADVEHSIFSNVLSYARRPLPTDEIIKGRDTWKSVAKDALQRDQRPCGNLAFLPLVSHALRQ